MSAPPTTDLPLEGHYVATQGSSGMQLGHDWFRIRTSQDGLGIVAESQHTVYGPGFPVQSVRLDLEPDWSPRRAEVLVADHGQSLTIDFDEYTATAVARSSAGEQQQRVPLERRRAWFTLNGGLYFPLHLVRRFDFDRPDVQRFAVFPMGTAEVGPDERVADQADDTRHLLVRLAFGTYEDTLELVVNARRELLRYHVVKQNLLVEQELR